MSETLERFMAKVSPEPMSGCWLWTGALSSGGYGAFLFEGQSANAHRIGYLLLCGAIGDGLELDHLCRVRSCVNPAHLEPVTKRENILRGEGATAKHARATHCKHGHLLAGDNLQPDPRRRSCRQCNAVAVRRYWARKRGAAG